jgi:hypothetical protein
MRPPWPFRGRARRREVGMTYAEPVVAPLQGEAVEAEDRPGGIPETPVSSTSDGVHIAYQTIGEGRGDLVFVPGFVFTVEQTWQWSQMARSANRLGSFARLILFDRPGHGSLRPQRVQARAASAPRFGRLAHPLQKRSAHLSGSARPSSSHNRPPIRGAIQALS